VHAYHDLGDGGPSPKPSAILKLISHHKSSLDNERVRDSQCGLNGFVDSVLIDNKYMDLKLGPAKPELERLTALFGTQVRWSGTYASIRMTFQIGAF
jgi:hypothetical protein